jgi:hypothetical protein
MREIIRLILRYKGFGYMDLKNIFLSIIGLFSIFPFPPPLFLFDEFVAIIVSSYSGGTVRGFSANLT